MHVNYNKAVSDPALVGCPQCDLLQRLPDLALGAAARCPRCNCDLWRRQEDSLNRTLALALAAAVLYVVANSVPMLGLTIVGRSASTTVIGGCRQLWDDGQEIVAVVVAFAVVIAPALQIGFMLAVTTAARREVVPRWVGTLLRHHPTTRTWSMIEVMLLGVLVALIKIAELATVIPGMALFVLGALVVVLTWMQTTFDDRDVWNRIEWAADEVAAEGSAAEVRT
jgi:paraquat-inducible protein A